MSDMGPDKTDTDWRARPSADSDDGHHRKDDAFGESECFSINPLTKQNIRMEFFFVRNEFKCLELKMKM